MFWPDLLENVNKIAFLHMKSAAGDCPSQTRAPQQGHVEDVRARGRRLFRWSGQCLGATFVDICVLTSWKEIHESVLSEGSYIGNINWATWNCTAEPTLYLSQWEESRDWDEEFKNTSIEWYSRRCEQRKPGGIQTHRVEKTKRRKSYCQRRKVNVDEM